ncbi:putative ATPase, AAA+ superfamily [Candidatus Methanophagaceae archaeon]|nr:putative ATPase, AAA+ superfamily [Methanophagales archaeon]
MGYSYIEKLQVTYAADSAEIGKREVAALLKVSGEFECKKLCMITWDYEEELKVKDYTIMCIPLWKWLIRKQRF